MKEKLVFFVSVKERIVLVFIGFFGLVLIGFLNGVGRGYIDLCVVLIVVVVNVDEL